MTTSTNQPIVVLVHGFLDDETMWDGVTSRLHVAGYPTVTPRIGWEGDINLEAFTEKVVEAVREEAPSHGVILVGHSMGSQVVELAAGRIDDVRGLVLISPVPLEGLSLPDEVAGPLRGCGENADVQRALRSQLSTDFTPEDLDRVVAIGSSLASSRVEAWFDTWSQGDPAAAESAPPAVPTALITADDPFAAGEVLDLVRARFTAADFIDVSGGGHWSPIENPDGITEGLLTFIGKSSTSVGWTQSFAAKSKEAFAEGFAEDIELHASALLKPILGREYVAYTMSEASKMYEELIFTGEASNDTQTFFEWTARTYSGIELAGVTMLERNDEGLVQRVAIHHRLLGNLLSFSKELGGHTKDVLPGGHFWEGELV